MPYTIHENDFAHLSAWLNDAADPDNEGDARALAAFEKVKTALAILTVYDAGPGWTEEQMLRDAGVNPDALADWAQTNEERAT